MKKYIHLSIIVFIILLSSFILCADNKNITLNKLEPLDTANIATCSRGVTIGTCRPNNLVGYAPEGWKRNSLNAQMMLFNENPFPLMTNDGLANNNTAYFWVNDETDDEPACNNELKCKSTCENICNDATGQGVLQDLEPRDHTGQHPNWNHCKTCTWNCQGGGQCYVLCCDPNQGNKLDTAR